MRTGDLVVRVFQLEAENVELRRQNLLLRRRDIARGAVEADAKALRAELYALFGRGYVRRRGRPSGPARSSGDSAGA